MVELDSVLEQLFPDPNKRKAFVDGLNLLNECLGKFSYFLKQMPPEPTSIMQVPPQAEANLAAQIRNTEILRQALIILINEAVNTLDRKAAQAYLASLRSLDDAEKSKGIKKILNKREISIRKFL